MGWDAFLEAWEQGVWQVRICRSCGAAWALPRPRCARCGTAEWDPATAHGPGTVTSWTRVHHEFFRRSAGAPPFCIAAVELDEFGPWSFVAEYVETPEAPPACGLRVQLTRKRGADGRERPAFEPEEIP